MGQTPRRFGVAVCLMWLVACSDTQRAGQTCGPGTMVSNGVCLPLSHDAGPIPDAGLHMGMDASAAVRCGPGTHSANGECAPDARDAAVDCGPGARWDGTRCMIELDAATSCGPGTQWRDGLCQADAGPVCASGTRLEAGKCVPVRMDAAVSCGEGTVLVDGECVVAAHPDAGHDAGPPANGVVAENALPGASSWQLQSPATAREIEGYASATSVNRGETIGLFVSTAAPGYALTVYRMGYYGGLGARQMTESVHRTGTLQTMPSPDADGRIECDWQDPYLLQTDASWVSGVYLVKLTADGSGKQAYIVFVLRDDASTADFLFQSSVTTYQAYNNWGGKSLYDFNSDLNQRAHKVSFNRPYGIGLNVQGSARGVGAGEFLTTVQADTESRPTAWEYSTVRFLEREGYSLTYATNLDVHRDPTLLWKHKAFLSVGHDEYWSWQMRDHVESARDRFGIHLGFFSANVCYWQVRFEADAHGNPLRTMVGYKDESLDPLQQTSDAHLVTTRWALTPLLLSEANMLGVRYKAASVHEDLVIDDDRSWVLAGTGLRRGDHLPGLLGYEVDGLPGALPAGMTRIAHSPWSTSDESGFADMVSWRVPKGAWVFAAGSIQFGWGLDDFGSSDLPAPLTHPAAQQLTRNVLARFLAPRAAQDTPVLLVDAFSGDSLDATRWQRGVLSEGSSSSYDPNVQVTQHDSLIIKPRARTSGLHHGGVVSASSYDLTNAAASVELRQSPLTGSAVDATFALTLDAAHYARFTVEGGRLYMQAADGGAQTSQGVALDPQTMRVLRLRHVHANTEWSWDVSADGQTFTTLRHSPTSFDVSALWLELEAGTYESEIGPRDVIFGPVRLERTGFTDDFTGPRRPQDWMPGTLSEGASYAPELSPIQFNGALRVRAHGSSPSLQTGGYLSATTWDLTGGSAQIEVSSASSADVMNVLALVRDADNWVRFNLQGASLHCEMNVAGVRTTSDVAYDASQQRFWRLSHDAGTQIWRWETSGNGNAWTTLRTQSAAFAVTALRAELMGGSAQASNASGETTFDNFVLQQGKFPSP